MPVGVEQGSRSAELGLLPTDVPPLADLRAWAAAELPMLGPDHLSVVLLVCTELVTNAYEHARSPERVTVRRAGSPCRVWVEVADGSTAPVTPGRSRLDENRGRGLTLVDRLATEWGVLDHPAGKTVWAEITCGAQGVRRC
jgi:anti-sigma regulatory factor (Ser/Thr protein kinase)